MLNGQPAWVAHGLRHPLSSARPSGVFQPYTPVHDKTRCGVNSHTFATVRRIG